MRAALGAAEGRVWSHLSPLASLAWEHTRNPSMSTSPVLLTALQLPLAGQLGACKEVVHRVLEHMEREPAADKRVPHFYLLDAILAVRRQRVCLLGWLGFIA